MPSKFWFWIAWFLVVFGPAATIAALNWDKLV